MNHELENLNKKSNIVNSTYYRHAPLLNLFTQKGNDLKIQFKHGFEILLPSAENQRPAKQIIQQIKNTA